MSKHKKILITILAFLILFIFTIFAYFLAKKPEPAIKAPVQTKALVNVIKVSSNNCYPVIKALGKVEAAEQVHLMSEVMGKIVKVNSNFVPGGFIKKGDIILEIDPTDYKIALAEAKNSYNKTQSAYKKALGRSYQAQEELKVYEKTTGKKIKNSYLALKKPELEQAKSDLEQAKNNLKKAKINLERTKIKAPFNTIIKDRTANYGAFVGTGVSIATLINTDTYWINAALPIKEMIYIDFTSNIEAIVKTSNQLGSRKANFFKILNYLDNSARFMGVLLVIDDPLLLKDTYKDNNTRPKIFLDDYVNVFIKGKEIKDVFKIPLFTLKNNNVVWLIKDDKLTLFKVDVVYQDDSYAYVKGLKEDDLIVDSDLSLVINDMPVKIKTIHKI